MSMESVAKRALVYCVDRSNEGVLVGGLENGDVKIYLLSKGVFSESQNLVFHKSAVLGIIFHGEKIVSCSFSGDLAFWKKEGNVFRFEKSIHLFNGAIFTIISLDDSIICGCSDGKIRIVTEEGSIVSEVEAHKRGVSGIAVWKNKMAVTGGIDGTVKVWRIPDMSLVQEFKEHSGAVRDCKISQTSFNDFIFASCSEDQTAVIYTKTNTKERFRTEKLSLGFPGMKASWSKSGTVLAVGSSTGDTKMFVPILPKGWKEESSLVL